MLSNYAHSYRIWLITLGVISFRTISNKFNGIFNFFIAHMIMMSIPVMKNIIFI